MSLYGSLYKPVSSPVFEALRKSGFIRLRSMRTFQQIAMIRSNTRTTNRAVIEGRNCGVRSNGRRLKCIPAVIKRHVQILPSVTGK